MWNDKYSEFDTVHHSFGFELILWFYILLKNLLTTVCTVYSCKKTLQSKNHKCHIKHSWPKTNNVSTLFTMSTLKLSLNKSFNIRWRSTLVFRVNPQVYTVLLKVIAMWKTILSINYFKSVVIRNYFIFPYTYHEKYMESILSKCYWIIAYDSEKCVETRIQFAGLM